MLQNDFTVPNVFRCRGPHFADSTWTGLSRLTCWEVEVPAAHLSPCQSDRIVTSLDSSSTSSSFSGERKK